MIKRAAHPEDTKTLNIDALTNPDSECVKQKPTETPGKRTKPRK